MACKVYPKRYAGSFTKVGNRSMCSPQGGNTNSQVTMAIISFTITGMKAAQKLRINSAHPCSVQLIEYAPGFLKK